MIAWTEASLSKSLPVRGPKPHTCHCHHRVVAHHRTCCPLGGRIPFLLCPFVVAAVTITVTHRHSFLLNPLMPPYTCHHPPCCFQPDTAFPGPLNAAHQKPREAHAHKMPIVMSPLGTPSIRARAFCRHRRPQPPQRCWGCTHHASLMGMCYKYRACVARPSSPPCLPYIHP